MLLTNLSAQLLPVTSSPQFAAHPSPAAPSSAQLYAVAFASFAAELLESLDARGVFLADHHAILGVADGLRGIRDTLESFIGRVINPLTNSIMKELLPLVEALEYSTPVFGSPPSQVKQTPIQHKGVSLHPSITAIQSVIYAHARNVEQYTSLPSMTSQTTLATLLISLIWRGLVVLSRRAPAVLPCVASTPTQQVMSPATLLWKKVGGNPTPPTTPPPVRFSIKLPPSRPPSPPSSQLPCPAMDARALYNLVNVLPRPSEDSHYALAREAVDEAFGGLAALCALLDYEAAGNLENLDGVTADLPTVIALPVLLRIFGGLEDHKEGGDAWDVPALLGMTDKEYRDKCLGGFTRAEECGPLVARNVLSVLLERRNSKCERLIHWLEGRAGD